MKKLLILFLLFIFSVQGTVAAMGHDLVLSVQDQEIACSIGYSPDSVLDDADGQQVSSDIEELSDYVAFYFPISKPPGRVASATIPAVTHFSTVLPPLKRPPRPLA
ncbi:hypothetical protein [Noviherbaspirillum denitrificans]|uniref:Uncharacterized protein n=1 Tax=Noviherbaspirillum denitrificans TaxID=1968433 RepID=A0A254TDA1_9BURK|nr:hypothetical protein [Noviherbaspirillum denitrificans]OWW20525.1 hypothetical protein AYR66_14545 [Noviherbaspirillum denitrificans]